MKSLRYSHNISVKKAQIVKKLKISIITAVAAVAGFASFATLIPNAHAQGGSGSGSGGSTTTITPTTTTTGGSGGGSTTPKAPCDAFSGTNAVADTTGITASYTLALCLSGKTVVNVQFRNPSGVVVYSVTDPINTTASIANIIFSANYTVSFTATSSRTASVVGTKTVIVTTPTLGVNCATNTTVVPRMGYYLTWAAVWINYSTLNCGYGMQTAEIKITNLDTGVVTADYTGMPTAMNLDYEGPVVSYNTNYQFEVIIHGAMNEVLDSSVATGTTVPQL